jgi:hypothetical protein
MASKFGKLTNVFLSILVIATIVLAKFVMPLDFGAVEFKIIDNTAYINAPMYSDSFSLNDIHEVKQIEDLPKMSKRNGRDSEIFFVGSLLYRDMEIAQYTSTGTISPTWLLVFQIELLSLMEIPQRKQKNFTHY